MIWCTSQTKSTTWCWSASVIRLRSCSCFERLLCRKLTLNYWQNHTAAVTICSGNCTCVTVTVTSLISASSTTCQFRKCYLPALRVSWGSHTYIPLSQADSIGLPDVRKGSTPTSEALSQLLHLKGRCTCSQSW